MRPIVELNNRKKWTFLSILGVIIIGYLVFTHFDNSTPKSNVIKKIANEQELKTIFDNAGSKILVIDFYADWCGPCRVIHPTIEALASKYAGKAEFLSVNIDQNSAIANTFMVQNIPDVMFFKNKQKVISLVGINHIESYEKVLTVCDSINGPCESDISDIVNSTLLK
jgi:thioredoxin 1